LEKEFLLDAVFSKGFNDIPIIVRYQLRLSGTKPLFVSDCLSSDLSGIEPLFVSNCSIKLVAISTSILLTLSCTTEPLEDRRSFTKIDDLDDDLDDDFLVMGILSTQVSIESPLTSNSFKATESFFEIYANFFAAPAKRTAAVTNIIAFLKRLSALYDFMRSRTLFTGFVFTLLLFLYIDESVDFKLYLRGSMDEIEFHQRLFSLLDRIAI
jgi:hypothetical protein